MSIIAKRSILTGMKVKEAMRRLVVRLPAEAGLDQAVIRMTKYKVSALLVDDTAGRAAGVVSKTDIMGAYYAGLPVTSPLSDIMVGPPLVRAPDDPVESALNAMREAGVHRVYVHGGADADPERVAGVLAYPDIVGLLYQYCHQCRRSLLRRGAPDGGGEDGEAEPVLRFTVRDVMTASVTAHPETDPLTSVMEGLSMHRFGAVLITDGEGRPAGVVSKSDLILAYLHGVDPETPAEGIMSAPVCSCEAGAYLETALRRIIFSEVQRIFVHEERPEAVVGVLSLSDAARIRSGSCQACVASRITPVSDPSV